MKLTKKIIYTGTIELQTGLHIGGNPSSLEIGGIDSPVIKTAGKVPYIPGSSLKGKLRALLAREEGATEIKNESETLKKLFGFSDKEKPQLTRLYFRDAYLDEKHFMDRFDDAELDLDYSEEKIENVINRVDGTASDLRNIERVPAGAKFDFEFVLNIYDNDDEALFKEKIVAAFNMLKDDYLGGSGSRGYGKVSIDYSYKTKNIKDYFKVES